MDNRSKVANVLLKLAKEMIANKITYKGYTIEPSGMNFYVKDPTGHRAFGEIPATIEMAKKWIDYDIIEKNGVAKREQ